MREWFDQQAAAIGGHGFAGVCHRTDRIAHVMEAIEKTDEIIVVRRIRFGGVDIEAHPLADPGLVGAPARRLDRARVIVESKESRFGNASAISRVETPWPQP